MEYYTMEVATTTRLAGVTADFLDQCHPIEIQRKPRT